MGASMVRRTRSRTEGRRDQLPPTLARAGWTYPQRGRCSSHRMITATLKSLVGIAQRACFPPSCQRWRTHQAVGRLPHRWGDLQYWRATTAGSPSAERVRGKLGKPARSQCTHEVGGSFDRLAGRCDVRHFLHAARCGRLLPAPLQSEMRPHRDHDIGKPVARTIAAAAPLCSARANS